MAVPFAPPRPFVCLAPAPPPQPCLPGLKALVLDGNFGVSDELLANLLAHTPQLCSLNLVLAGGSSWGCCPVVVSPWLLQIGTGAEAVLMRLNAVK